MRRMPGSVYTLPVPAILYLSAIKYKNDPRSLAIKSTQVLSVTFIRSANSHYSFVFLRNYPFG